jgi:hypothetical protein
VNELQLIAIKTVQLSVPDLLPDDAVALPVSQATIMSAFASRRNRFGFPSRAPARAERR